MKTIMTLFLFLFISQTSFAATAQVNNVGQVGTGITTGTTQAPPAGLTVPAATLKGSVYGVSGSNNNATTVYNYMQFVKVGYPAGQQWKVSAGKFATCMDITVNSASHVQLQFGYTTATFTNNTAAASPPASAVCYDGTTCSATAILHPYYFPAGAITASVSKKVKVDWDASSTGANADIYPFWRTDDASPVYIDMICYEQ